MVIGHVCGKPSRLQMPHKPTSATFELTVRTDRPLFTIIMRPKGLDWSLVTYWANGSINKIETTTPESFIAVFDAIKREREGKSDGSL